MNDTRRFMSLKSKIMISTLIPVVVSLALVCSVIFLPLFNSLRETAEAEFLQISQKYASSFEGKINSAMNYLSILASELEMQAERGTTDRETLQKSVMKIFENYKLIDGSSVYFEPGMYDDRDADYLGTEYGTAKSGRICWYFYMDDGRFAYLPEGLDDDIEFELPHYTEAKKANKPIYTNPVAYEIDGKNIPMFTLTYPIRDNSGQFIGAITVDLFLDDIYMQLQDEKIYDTGYIFIANDNGQIIYSPRYEDIGKTREEAGLNYPIPSGDEASTFLNAKSIINGKDTLVTINSIYIPQLDSYFYISVTAPLDEINADGTRLMILLIAFGLIVVAAIALLLNFLIGRISAPLYEITESVDKIASGDYNARINGTYKGEYAVVKNSVNTMADSIEAYIEESKNSLNTLKNILNGLDAAIYVTVPDTGEMLFINEKMKGLYSIEGEGVGQICYKVFQEGINERCEFCPCFQLDKEPDAVIVWEEHSTLTKRYYRNTDRYIDWPGGRKAHLQHSVDITDIKIAQSALSRRLGQQALMTSISQSFLSDTDIETLIANALRMTGEFIGVAQILFYRFEEDGVTLTCQSEWINPELDLQTRIGDNLVLKGPLLSVMKDLSEDKDFCLNSNDPFLKAAMAPYRVNFQNYMTTPIFLKGNIYGTLDFSREDSGKEWSESDISLATLVSSLLSGVFERRFIEGQLRRLSSIVESSPQFIIDIAVDGKVDYVNPAAETITGHTESELIEGGLDIIFDRQTVQDIKETYIPNTMREGTDNFEIDLICKDGQRRIMAFSSFTTGSGSANVGGIASDVTEIRKLESELIAAKELAEQGSRSKSEFLSRMSHEMRTPMNAIIGMTSIAQSSDDSGRKDYCLEKIDDASKHLLGVINDILDMSKIEANKFDLSPTEFSFEKMLQKVVNVINFRIDEKQLEFTVHIDKHIPRTLIGDDQRLAQVITNLLSNAVKFTPECGSIRLSTHLAKEEKGICTIQIEVTDTGIGISEEQQARIFTSFEQAENSTSRKFGGTGLGLAISKRIVEMMNGKVWIESELGKGSTFAFTIEMKRGKEKQSSLLSPGVNWKNIRVLAVDDAPEILEYFEDIAGRFGLACDTAASGEEAIGLILHRGSYDIYFVDWKMPEMDGIELSRRIKENSLGNSVIIMISAAEWSVIETEAKNAGVDKFLPKPLFPSAIADCINECLGANALPPPEDAPDEETDCFEGYRVLLAEDVEINREIVLALLEPTSLAIECAVNGAEAVRLFSEAPERYDMILMDVQMPEMDGYEATRNIRALDAQEAKSVPIIAMTANVFREDVEACLAGGMNDHIGKPIDFNELMIKLRKYLR